MNHWKHLNSSFFCALILLALLVAPLAAQTDVERRIDASPRGEVEISNISGSVTVIGWDRNEVEITGTLGREVEELHVEGGGGKVEIDVKLPRRSHGDSSADLEIHVPRGSSVEVEAVSAEVLVRDVDGRVDLESVSGAVTVQGGGEIEVETVSGEIVLSGAMVGVDAESVSGRISVDARELEGAVLESVSGKIEINAGLGARADLDIETVSGRVILNLPSGTAADFDLESFSGDIENGLTGEEARRTDRYAPGKALKFSTGGDANVIVETHSGDIELNVD